ncbi:hypothetical protein M0804_003641 [Polistes exclamans]|nr:hypothetical protein M0804_003641 [Polistes exclamans]
MPVEQVAALPDEPGLCPHRSVTIIKSVSCLLGNSYEREKKPQIPGSLPLGNSIDASAKLPMSGSHNQPLVIANMYIRTDFL